MAQIGSECLVYIKTRDGGSLVIFPLGTAVLFTLIFFLLGPGKLSLTFFFGLDFGLFGFYFGFGFVPQMQGIAADQHNTAQKG